MYQPGGRPGAVTTTTVAGTGAGLAFTGFPAIGFTILALLVIVVGLLLVRVAMIRRNSEAGGGDSKRGRWPFGGGGGEGGGSGGSGGSRGVRAARVRAAGNRMIRSSSLRKGSAVLALGAGVGLLLEQAHVRLWEAALSAGILRWTHIAHARPVGSSVVFSHGARWIGFTVATSCTAALLIAPFFVVGSALLIPRRLSVRRVVVALGAVSAIVWTANQVRLLLIGASMSLWGFDAGYSRSHILAGGIVSTLGLAIGIAAYVGLLLHQRPSPQGGTT